MSETSPWMIIGTCHFVSLRDAVRYYKPYGFALADVQRKLDEGEIYIGKPPLDKGETLFIVDGGTRYAIYSPKR